jgi:hypothetical protein
LIAFAVVVCTYIALFELSISIVYNKELND